MRKIIQIDEERCVGCGLCANACQQGAIAMVDGKAKVVRDDYCDGIGNCLPVCPVGAITFSDRDITSDNVPHITVKAPPTRTGCPGNAVKTMGVAGGADLSQDSVPSQLTQWPLQIKLAPVNAKFFENAHLLIASDCSAFAYGNFHADFMKDKITLIGCPKLDSVDYTEKLTQIIASNSIRSVTVARMEVPCCGGLQFAVQNAVVASRKFPPCKIVTIGINGNIIETKNFADDED